MTYRTHEYLYPLITQAILLEVKNREAVRVTVHGVNEFLTELDTQIHLVKDDLAVD